jgi:hypothetical protein
VADLAGGEADSPRQVLERAALEGALAMALREARSRLFSRERRAASPA